MCKTQVYIVFSETDVLYRLNKSDKNSPNIKNLLDNTDVEI